MSRRKVLRISGDLLTSVFGEGERTYRVVNDPIPSDAEIVGVKHNWDSGRDVLEILLQSEQFPDAEEGLPYPELDIKIETITPWPREAGNGMPPGCGESPIKLSTREISDTDYCSPRFNLALRELPGVAPVCPTQPGALATSGPFDTTRITGREITGCVVSGNVVHECGSGQPEDPNPVKFREFL